MISVAACLRLHLLLAAMSRKMALSVPTKGVIDDKMIRASIISAIKQNYEEKAAARKEREKKRGDEKRKPKIKFEQMEVEFDECQKLALSFNNIARIANLDGLRSLHTLQLDNNTIEKIENLDHLSNLTWLDLSFNNLQEITGLEHLTKLTDLTLFNNAISSLSGLETLSNLNVLSIGNNKLGDVKEIKMLREFKELNVLSMDGNPVCTHAEYKMMVLAFLPAIKFFDFVLVDQEDLILAKEQYQDDLQELAEHEKMASESAAAATKRGELLKKYQDASIDPITTLMDTMFQEDTDTQKLLDAPLRGLDELKADYSERLVGLGEIVRVEGLKLFGEQKQEITEFEQYLKKAREESQKEAIAAVRTYKEAETSLFRELEDKIDALDEMDEVDGPLVVDKDFASLKQFNEDLKNKLMETELLLAEQCELIISEFELRYGNLRVKSADIMEKYFRGAEDAENGYFEMVSSLVEELVELSNKDELEDITEECRLLLADKESLNTHVAAAHDTHLSKLLGVEEELRDRVTNQTAACFKAYRDAEWKRNRHAVLDIRGIVEDNYDAIEKFMREFNEDSAEMD